MCLGNGERPGPGSCIGPAKANRVQNLHHFDSIDAPVHDLVTSIQKTLQLNKKVASKGDW